MVVFDRGGNAKDNIALIRRRSRAKYRLNAHGVRVFTFHWNRFSSPVCWFNKLIARERGSSGHDGWPKTRGAPILYVILHGCAPRSGGGVVKATCTVHMRFSSLRGISYEVWRFIDSPGHTWVCCYNTGRYLPPQPCTHTSRRLQPAGHNNSTHKVRVYFGWVCVCVCACVKCKHFSLPVPNDECGLVESRGRRHRAFYFFLFIYLFFFCTLQYNIIIL